MEELKGKCDLAPLTPAKSVPNFIVIDKPLNHDVGTLKNPQLPQIWGKLGQKEKESGNSNFNFTVCYERVDEVAGQCSGSGEDNLGLHGNSKGINGGIPDNENRDYGFVLDTEKASSLPNNPTPRKRRNVNNGVDSNKTPRKRVRMKRHRPKVFDETKAKKPSTPKLKTPKRPSRSLKKKVTLKTSTQISKDAIKEAIDELIKPSCRRELVFDSKDAIKEAIDELIKPSCRRELTFDLEKDTSSVCNGVEDKQEVEPKLQIDSSTLCLEMDVSKVCDGVEDEPKVGPKPQLDSSSLQVYKRRFRPNECLKNSRKIGPNFPKMCKKTRMNRKRATMFEKFIFTKISDEISNNFTMKLRSRKKMERKTSSASVSKVEINWMVRRKRSKTSTQRRDLSSLAIDVSVSKKKINWIVHSKRKRSKKSTRRRDLSSLAIDLSKIEVSEDFLLNASKIRTKVNEDEKLTAHVEIQDKGINSAIENSIEQQELIEDQNVLEIDHQTVKDQNVLEIDHQAVKDQNVIEIEIDHQAVKGQNVLEIDHQVVKDQNVLDFDHQVVKDQNVLEIDHEVVMDQNVLEKSMKEMGSFSDKLTFENKCQFRDSSGEFSQSVEGQEKVKVKVKCTNKILQSDSVKPDLAGPSNKQKDALSRQYDDAFTEALVNYACKKMERLNIDDKFNQLAVRDLNGQNILVLSKEKFDLSKLQKPVPKVDLDPETLRVWNLLMENNGSENTEQDDIDKAKYWEKEHEIFRGRLDSFIARMHLILGDRRFSPWKGSVVDSVVGVFLTQNVSDTLSSSAFMSLAAKFPLPSVSEHNGTNDSVICENDTQHFQVEMPESPPRKFEELEPMESYPSSSPDNLAELEPENGNKIPSQTESTSVRKKGNVKDKQETPINWDDLRKKYSRDRPRNSMTADTVDWEAVRKAPFLEVAEVIVERGMNNMLARRIQGFLNRIVEDHGSIDLEWLRDVPPDKAKSYLLSIDGLGLKSVECIRLLALHHHAFPVDVNVGRILVRLGWVPLKPLPEDVQIHLLNQYPMLDSIQQYIWPRLSVRDQKTLYEGHYQMITFGKSFCTKIQPNCNACPMRGECKHFASAFASARLRLTGPQQESPTTELSPFTSGQDPMAHKNTRYSEPIIEFPSSPEPDPEPEIIDMEDYGYDPASKKSRETDIDGYNNESDDEIPIIRLIDEEFKKNILEIVEENNLVCSEGDMSKTLVTLRPEQASIPMPKMKYVDRLKTVHQVYELPDSHPLLAGKFEKREPDDPCPYLLVIWATVDESTDSPQDSRKACENDLTVQGTVLIPCRTANRGSFPLNGTYFQVNEVFADQESSRSPIDVPREWIWNLKRRTLFCGKSVTSISKGLSMDDIAFCFRYGFICVRGFDRASRRPRALSRRFHRQGKLISSKKK